MASFPDSVNRNDIGKIHLVPFSGSLLLVVLLLLLLFTSGVGHGCTQDLKEAALRGGSPPADPHPSGEHRGSQIKWDYTRPEHQ